MSVGFNQGVQTPLVDYSKAMVCLMYGTKVSPSHMITGSRGVVSPTMNCFLLMLATTQLRVIHFSEKTSQFVQLSRKQTYENMKTSFVVFTLVMLLVAISGAQTSGKPRLYISSKRSVALCSTSNLQKGLSILAHERIPNYFTIYQHNSTN